MTTLPHRALSRRVVLVPAADLCGVCHVLLPARRAGLRLGLLRLAIALVLRTTCTARRVQRRASAECREGVRARRQSGCRQSGCRQSGEGARRGRREDWKSARIQSTERGRNEVRRGSTCWRCSTF